MWKQNKTVDYVVMIHVCKRKDVNCSYLFWCKRYKKSNNTAIIALLMELLSILVLFCRTLKATHFRKVLSVQLRERKGPMGAPHSLGASSSSALYPIRPPCRNKIVLWLVDNFLLLLCSILNTLVATYFRLLVPVLQPAAVWICFLGVPSSTLRLL